MGGDDSSGGGPQGGLPSFPQRIGSLHTLISQQSFHSRVSEYHRPEPGCKEMSKIPIPSRQTHSRCYRSLLHFSLFPVHACSVNPGDCSLPGSAVRGIFIGKNTGVVYHFLLQRIFLTQGLNPRLESPALQVNLPLSHRGSP